jgi:uncharacterized protein (TIGR02145 family)
MRHKKFKLIALLLFGIGSMGLQGQTTGTFTDSRDDKIYKTVKIGEQVWMAENLAYKPTSGNYWAYGNKAVNIAVYGYLYDWQTAQNVCPNGWHLPSDTEWTVLIDYLGGKDGAGGKLKEAGTQHWKSPNTGATNEVGFSALPGGRSGSGEAFYSIGNSGYWWSATHAWGVDMYYDGNDVYRLSTSESFGFSVRCVRD